MSLARSPLLLSVLLMACAPAVAEELDEPSAELEGQYQSALVDEPCPGEDADMASARRAIAHVRALAGLPMLRCDRSASAAARAHCEYVEANGGKLTHVEERGQPRFTGASFEDRLAAAAFSDSPAGEVMASITGADSITGTRGYLNSVYHRPFFLRTETVSFGYGATTACSTVDFGRVKDLGSVKDIPIVWPPNGARGVPFRFYADHETPNPMPGSSVVGTPVSLVRTANITRLVATLTGPDGVVPTTTLTHENDKNHLVRNGEAHMIPLSPLQSDTLYRARFEFGNGGSIEASFTTTHPDG